MIGSPLRVGKNFGANQISPSVRNGIEINMIISAALRQWAVVLFSPCPFFRDADACTPVDRPRSKAWEKKSMNPPNPTAASAVLLSLNRLTIAMSTKFKIFWETMAPIIGSANSVMRRTRCGSSNSLSFMVSKF